MSLPAIGMSAYFGISAIKQYTKGNKRLAYTCATLAIAIIVHHVYLHRIASNLDDFNLK